MSLIKQLWIAIIVVTAFALGGSLVVSTLSARHYLEQQLHVKNIDNATSLALSLSQMPKDPVTVELQVATQFDAGHYRLIRLLAPDGEVLVERVFDGAESAVPAWFLRLVPIEAAPGVAQVQDGWRQFGTLTVESHSRYAYDALWNGTLELLAWFGVGGLLTGLLGTFIIRTITHPLRGVVEQAEAIGGRRFVTTPEPGTTEFRSVVRAMNTLSGRVRSMLAEESQRLETLRRQTQHDELTDLPNRAHFMNLLESGLHRDDAQSAGILMLVRITNLAALNQRFGREATDDTVCRVGRRLLALSNDRPGHEAGRISPSDMALLAPNTEDTQAFAARLADDLRATLGDAPAAREAKLVFAGAPYAAGEARAQLLARLDAALALAEQEGDGALRIAAHAGTPLLHTDLPGWRNEITRALMRDGVQLGHFPVIDRLGQLLHEEAPVRLKLGDNWEAAGYFMPWVARLGLQPQVDLAVARAAVRELNHSPAALGINIATESLCDIGFREALHTLLRQHPQEARRLWLDLPEFAALHHAQEFRALCATLRPLGCRLGLEHIGARFGQLRDLHEIGLDYLKIDAAIVRGIHSDAGNQNFLRGLCTIAHSIGLMTIAEGVEDDAEGACLLALGLDGMTGPGVARGGSPRP